MIVVRLSGALGNQMFEYAAGRSLALRNNTQLKLDASFYSLNLEPKRIYSLGTFKIKEDFASEDELEDLKVNENNPLRKYFPRLSAQMNFNHKPSHVREANLKTSFLTLPDNTYLDGYWQSEKYFKWIEKIIRREFEFKTPPVGLNARVLNAITHTNSVSIHIRRTDYLNSRSQKLYYHCPESYFTNAVELVASRVNQPKFYIFSDDPDWVKRNLKLKFPTTYIVNNSIDMGYEDLRLMSNCKHNIIVNSSFSWWGAWLNYHKNKIIIAPKKWFLNPQENINDRIPLSWKKI